MRLARKAGAFTLAVTNSPGSPVAEEAEAVLLTRCGLSLSFPTKTTTSALVLLFRLAVALGRARGRLSSERADALLVELDALPTQVEKVLSLEQRVQVLVERLGGCEHFSFIGTGPSYTAALLGEAKLKETSQTRAEAHQLEEFAHVHLFAMQSGDPLFFIASSDSTNARAREIAAYALSYGAQGVALVAEGGAAVWQSLGVETIELPSVEKTFSPIVHVVPLQLFAYHLALAKGHNPDRPARFDNVAHQKLVYSALLEGWYES
jgi:glucosamine--fructose-6-phosphate aminotransferase (isomerizing)